jgi:hypothetical protein
VARKSKTEIQKQADGQASDPNGGSAGGTDPKTTGAAPKPRRKKAAPKKKTARPVKPAASRKTSSPASIPEPSDEEIALRAYFIAERRIQLSLAGDSARDWIEARRQLIEEAGPKSS